MSVADTTAVNPGNDSYTLIEDDNALKRLCGTWKGKHFLALDTEFIRTRTFYPKAGLIQVNDGAANYLVDPLKISDWAAFCDLMLDPAIDKIFHSCSEDLQVFMAELSLIPNPVFDTQLAASFLNEGFGCSYQNLVKLKLNLELPKGETRSDWLQRPLAETQCHYAALDVACLPAIYLRQKQALEESGRLGWLEEECLTLVRAYETEMQGDFSTCYLNLKGAWQLNRRQLGVLQNLAQWRELRARRRDKPRNWIVRDKALLDIARLCPARLDQLKAVEGVGKHFFRFEGGDVLREVAKALDKPEDALPPLLPRPLSFREKNRLKNGQQFVEEKSRELALPVEMLARKRWLLALLQNMIECEGRQQEGERKDEDGKPCMDENMIPVELSGWRKALLFPALLDVMS